VSAAANYSTFLSPRERNVRTVEQASKQASNPFKMARGRAKKGTFRHHVEVIGPTFFSPLFCLIRDDRLERLSAAALSFFFVYPSLPIIDR
jgi:hypothetical protein